MPLRVPVEIFEPGTGKRFIVEETHSLSVSLHGGVIALSTKVGRGQVLLVANKTTQESKECRVVYLGPIHSDKRHVGIEFTQPAPDFWNIAFPPPDSKAIPE